MSSLHVLIVFLNYLSIHFARTMESDVDFLTHYASDLAVTSDLEQQLKNKLTQKRKSIERLHKLNEHIAKDTEYFEEIPHFTVNSSKRIRGKLSRIENAFKKVIGMVGVKYMYNRDLKWRTWREIKYPNNTNTTEVICYTCQNILKPGETNCTTCKLGGYWVIEENQPKCSYEIFSYKNYKELCVAKFWELNKANLNSCPAVIPIDEIYDCSLPIITKYIVNVDYSWKGSERTLPTICQRRQECAFSTVYAVSPENIVFRIINATNNIIFSRIMKPNKKIYVCVDNCGIFDFDTKMARRNEDHLVLDLFHSNKKKRDNLKPRKQKKKALNSNKGAFSKKYLFINKHKYNLEQPFEREYSSTNRPSMCKQILLKELYNDMNDEHAFKK